MICVLGGGPAGLTYALEVSRLRPELQVLVLEEHASIGVPPHCAGLVSLDALNGVYAHLWRRAALNTVRGCLVHGPGGEVLRVEAGSDVAAVLDRVAFERLLAGEAERLGCRIETRARVLGAGRGGLVVKGREAKVSFDLAVLATGARAELNGAFGIQSPKGLIPALNAEYELMRPVDERVVHIYLDKRLAPSFFAWMIPVDEHRVRVGLAAETGLRKRLGLLERLDPGRVGLGEARRRAVYGGYVVTGGLVKNPVGDHAIALGDAAGQVKPTTGGGIAMLSKAAVAAARLTASVEGFTRRELLPYRLAVERALGREIRLMLAARRWLNSLENRDISALLSLAGELGIAELASRRGHMDYQSEFIRGAAGRLLPRALLSPRLLASLLRSIVSLCLPPPPGGEL